MLSIIIPVFNQLKYTQQIVKEIETKCVWPFEIIIIDDCSTDWTHEWLINWKVQKWYKKKYHRNEVNMWTNYWRNKWVELAEAEYLRIINNDILLTHWLDKELHDVLLKWHSVACPLSTIGLHKRKLPLFKKKDNICWWCFMMRKDKRRPIPPQLVLWYWDDYIYRYNPNVGYAGRIHHFESISIRHASTERQKQDEVERNKIHKQPLFRTK